MSEELTQLEQVMVTQIEATKISLNPGDTLMITIKCDDLDEFSLSALKKSLGKIFPDNKVGILGMGVKDGVEFTIVSSPEISYPEQVKEKE